jgi:hypothetical protein
MSFSGLESGKTKGINQRFEEGNGFNKMRSVIFQDDCEKIRILFLDVNRKVKQTDL